ncbi:MAG: monofunctional biosynthetic peptidoglycan transglycosylase [Gammaproteobacteria bacterium]|nr:monofunctional biosynthetic peptidoglycan transglycosylase [Gammaproteobacteria bacterium]
MSWKSRTQKIKSTIRQPKIWRIIKWSWRVLIVLVIIDAGYIIAITPDWDLYATGPVQQSRFIQKYKQDSLQHKQWPNLRWNPVSLSRIPDHVVRAIVVAEDSRFFQHNGFDEEAFKEAMQYNLSKGQLILGASTISQQTVKNLFLSSSRNLLRKWHEFVLTYTMERNISKKRIIEIYLNVAEFGLGIYGVEAASHYYWGKSVSELSFSEAVELAATLPAPVRHNPSTQSKYFIRRKNKIRKHLGYI